MLAASIGVRFSKFTSGIPGRLFLNLPPKGLDTDRTRCILATDTEFGSGRLSPRERPRPELLCLVNACFYTYAECARTIRTLSTGTWNNTRCPLRGNCRERSHLCRDILVGIFFKHASCMCCYQRDRAASLEDSTSERRNRQEG